VYFDRPHVGALWDFGRTTIVLDRVPGAITPKTRRNAWLVGQDYDKDVGEMPMGL